MSDLFMTFHITLKMYIVKYLLDFEDKRKNIFTVKKKSSPRLNFFLSESTKIILLLSKIHFTMN
jgi:hypothetical protein